VLDQFVIWNFDIAALDKKRSHNSPYLSLSEIPRSCGATILSLHAKMVHKDSIRAQNYLKIYDAEGKETIWAYAENRFAISST